MYLATIYNFFYIQLLIPDNICADKETKALQPYNININALSGITWDIFLYVTHIIYLQVNILLSVQILF